MSLLEFASEAGVTLYVGRGTALPVYFCRCSARLDRVSRLVSDCIAVRNREQRTTKVLWLYYLFSLLFSGDLCSEFVCLRFLSFMHETTA